MEIMVHMPDGETVTVEVDDDRFEQARGAWEARGQTFEEAFTEYLREFLAAHPIVAQGQRTIQ